MTDKELEYCWLVGASAGIGKALAHELANEHRVLFISARRQELIEQLSEELPGQVIPVSCDFTDSVSLEQAVHKIRQMTDRLDRLIINAGTCEYPDANDLDIELFERVMDSNFFGPLKTIKQSLPLLLEAPAPHMVLISSSVTFLPLPRAEAYGASKAALEYMAGSLATDLRDQGVQVSIVKPGFVKTPLTDKNDFSMPFLVSAEFAGKKIYQGILKRKSEIHFPARFTLILKLLSQLPWPWKVWLGSKMSQSS